MIGRRGFLGSIAGLLAASTLDPERALWVPGAKTISIPEATTVNTRLLAEYFINSDSYLVQLDQEISGSMFHHVRADIPADEFQQGWRLGETPRYPSAAVQERYIGPMAEHLRWRTGYRVPRVPIHFLY